MAQLSRDVIYDRFASAVRSALATARDRGMTDPDIEEATGVSYGTFHRWAGKRIGTTGPQPTKVKAFFDGLGLDWKGPFRTLGWSTDQTAPPAEPEPDIPREVREILRRLRDPNTPTKEREFIVETLKSLISRPRPRTGAAAARERQK